jgi:putative transcriptional regulator
MDLTFNKDTHIEKSYLLLSAPSLDDPNFNRAVILLCQYNEEGAFGLVFNQPSAIRVQDVSKNNAIKNALFIGGPVEQNHLFFVHHFADLKGTIELKDGIYWGGDFDELSKLNISQEIQEKDCRFFVGYSGWEAGQLEEEIANNSWIISKVSPQVLFETEAKDLWKKILQQMGGKYKAFSNYPHNPYLN